MKTLTRSVLLMGLVAVLQVAVSAQGGNWRLQLGVSYRNFDDVDFESVEFRNWGAQTGGGPFGVQNATTTPASNVDLDYVRWDGTSEDIDDLGHWSPVLGVYKPLGESERFSLGIAAHMQYYCIESNVSTAGDMASPDTFTAIQYNHQARAGTILPVFPGALPNVPPVAPVGGTMTSFRMDADTEMHLLVFDCGLQASIPVAMTEITAGLGPTVSIADVDSEQKGQVTWSAQPGVDAGTQRIARSDSETDILFGGFASVGISVDVTENLQLAADYRYDFVDGHAGDDLASMDLDGSSGQVAIRFNF
mgnify:CR=1 FL=1